MKNAPWIVLLLAGCCLISCKNLTVSVEPGSYSGWSAYAGSKDGIR